MSAVVQNGEFAQLGLLPTVAQMWALRAALLPAQQARSAFAEWLGLIDLEADFDQGTFRLLPLMYENLRQCGVQHPLMSRLKGVYRLTWYKNNKLFSDLTPVVSALEAAKIPTMLLKGVPLIDRYYGNIALRPMADIDLLVPAERLREALEVMRGFAYQMVADPTSDYLKYRHALGYRSESNGEFDLHWHAFYECCDSEADRVFWDNAKPMPFNGIACLAPDATRMLLHTVIHGFRWNFEPPIRWIPDAIMILRNAGNEIDWNAMVDYALFHQLDYRLRMPLLFLKENFEAPVPEWVLAKLAARAPTPIQRIENTCILRDPTRLHSTPMGHLWLVFGDYCRFARNDKAVAFLNGFAHYLRFRWGLRGRGEIPAYIGRGLAKRAKQVFAPKERLPGVKILFF